MRVPVTTAAPGLDVEIEPHFWHAAYLTIVDTDTLQWDALPALGAPSVHAAGTDSACWPPTSAWCSHQQRLRAEQLHRARIGGIPRYLSGTCKTAHEAVEQFKAGKLAGPHPTSARPQELAATR